MKSSDGQLLFYLLASFPAPKGLLEVESHVIDHSISLKRGDNASQYDHQSCRSHTKKSDFSTTYNLSAVRDILRI